jgi:Region found in RelA / SpoT proteins
MIWVARDSGSSSEGGHPWSDIMAWASPKHSREEVNRAGKVLVSELYSDLEDGDFITDAEWAHSLEVINNWRSCHGYPLNTFQLNLRKAARRIDGSSLIAQRTKRLSSIANKLRRFPTMKLSQMQDIGGCRAVVKSVSAVRDLADFYQNTSRIKHKLATCDDYIAKPPESGYRGIHLVYRYYSDKRGSKKFNDLKIEMQLRSQYQHAWATAVETVGTFIRQALKSSVGEADWLRFFALMGSALALRERTTPVPGTPTKRSELMDELAEYTIRLNVEHRLRVYGDALQAIEQTEKDAHYYLLRLDPASTELFITGFRSGQIAEAEKQYAEAEKHVKSHPGTDAVLVAVDSVAALRRAYPNYFADTRAFVKLLVQALRGRRSHIPSGQLELELPAS